MSDGMRSLMTKPPQDREQSGPLRQQSSVLSVSRWCLLWLFAMISVPPLGAQTGETTDDPNHASHPLYQATQQALDTLVRAEIDREEASLGGESLASVRKQLRGTISQFQSVETQLTTLLRETYQQPLSVRAKSSWSVQELESLYRNLKVQQARAYRNQSLCYADASNDQVNALSLALEQLTDIVTLPLDEPSVWQARIEQVVCLRLLQKTAETRQQIKRWQNAAPPDKIASRLLGETLRTDLDEGALEQALAKVLTHLESNKSLATTAPETDDAIMEILLAARQQATPRRASQLTDRATQQLQRIAKIHGPYWKRRAEVRLGRSLTEENHPLSDTNDPELLTHAATSLYVAGNFREAVSAYDRAAKRFAAEGAAERQFQSLKTAAAIVRESQPPAAALRRFQTLALQHPQHAEAATMHLIAIGLAAESSRDAPTAQRGGQFERYLNLLREHLQRWPQQPSAETVRQWLTRTQLPAVQRQRAISLAALGDRPQALVLVRQLVNDAPHDAEQLEVYAQLLAEGTDRSELREALLRWQQIEARTKPGDPRWLRGRRARLELLERLGEGGQAKQLRQLTEILYPQSLEP